MNVYDEAHKLEQAVRESEEYKEFIQLKQIIESNPDMAAKIHDFEQKQLEQQTKQMLGQEMDSSFLTEVQSLYQLIMADPTAARYLQAEMRFSLMMSDVYKILGDLMNVGK